MPATQMEVIRKEEATAEKKPQSDWPICKLEGIFMISD